MHVVSAPLLIIVTSCEIGWMDGLNIPEVVDLIANAWTLLLVGDRLASSAPLVFYLALTQDIQVTIAEPALVSIPILILECGTLGSPWSFVVGCSRRCLTQLWTIDSLNCVQILKLSCRVVSLVLGFNVHWGVWGLICCGASFIVLIRWAHLIIWG